MSVIAGFACSRSALADESATVRGSLDKEIIRRIIQRHLNEVKYCYEKELIKKADLSGRVMIQFTISATGEVVKAVVQDSTMNNPSVEECIAGAVKRWEFPKPEGGGIVIVSYPFVLKTAGDDRKSKPDPPSGSLDKEIIRRVIQRHLNEVKTCFEKELAQDSKAGGKLLVRFVVNPNGDVGSAAIESSTTKNPILDNCIAARVRTWVFPKPQGGGVVAVTYPFVLKAADEGASVLTDETNVDSNRHRIPR